MKVIIKTHDDRIIIYENISKIEFGWMENEMYAYIDGMSFPIELLKEVQND